MSIIDYIPTPADHILPNPYLDDLQHIIAANNRRARECFERILLERRSELVSRYAFAIPTAPVIEAIAACSPLIEIGAGSGYWAWCLASAGADVVAYDIRPPSDDLPWQWQDANQWFEDTWFLVMEGDERMAARYPERALFLCWPPDDGIMANQAVRLYLEAGGERIIYVGRPFRSDGGLFSRRIEESLTVCQARPTPSWPGIEEWMIIYRTARQPAVREVSYDY